MWRRGTWPDAGVWNLFAECLCGGFHWSLLLCCLEPATMECNGSPLEGAKRSLLHCKFSFWLLLVQLVPPPSWRGLCFGDPTGDQRASSTDLNGDHSPDHVRCDAGCSSALEGSCGQSCRHDSQCRFPHFGQYRHSSGCADGIRICGVHCFSSSFVPLLALRHFSNLLIYIFLGIVYTSFFAVYVCELSDWQAGNSALEATRSKSFKACSTL